MKYEYNEQIVWKMNTMNKVNERSLTCPPLLDCYINTDKGMVAKTFHNNEKYECNEYGYNEYEYNEYEYNEY